jgi:hypothetical protein
VQDLSGAGQSANSPQVAVDPNGNAVVVWSLFDGTNSRIQARRRSASGTLSSKQTLSAAGQDAQTPQVAVDANGNAVVVWQRSDGTNVRIQARYRSASGTLSSVQTLSAAGQDASDPQVSVDPNGNAVAVWWRSDGTNARIQARRRSASGTLSSVQDVSEAGQDAQTPQVSVDPNGNAVVVWQWYDGTNFRIQARRRAASGNLSSVQTLSEGGQHAQYPQVAVDTKGNASAVWIRADGLNTLIQSGRL